MPQYSENILYYWKLFHSENLLIRQDIEIFYTNLNIEAFNSKRFSRHGLFHGLRRMLYLIIYYPIFFYWDLLKSPVYPYKNHYCSARNGTKPEKEEKSHDRYPNYGKDGPIIGNSDARDVRTSVVDDIPESSNRFFVRLKHLDIVHVALPIFHVARVIPCYHPAFIVWPYHCPDWAVMCLYKQKN